MINVLAYHIAIKILVHSRLHKMSPILIDYLTLTILTDTNEGITNKNVLFFEKWLKKTRGSAVAKWLRQLELINGE